jgi:GABA(A) receptor-associated protein
MKLEDIKAGKTLEERKLQSQQFREKYPERIPVIITKDEKSICNEIAKNKFAFVKSARVAEVLCVLRNLAFLSNSDAICVLVNNEICMGSQTLGELDAKHKDEDGFLYLKYTIQNTFG